jgi:ABC-type polysaccharide/polyol phosphate export permease
MLGKDYGFLAWSSMHFFIFLSAPFFSHNLFPIGIRHLSEIMPFTYVFEAARALAVGAPVTTLSYAFLISAAYVIIAWPCYFLAFKRSRKTGVLARIS